MNAHTRIGQFEIISAVGAGGMGEVFRARDTRLHRDVAVKVLPRDFVADADRLRRFEQEAKTLAALNHPNVLTIHDAGVHEGAPYLVSELLEGKTLRDVLGSTPHATLPLRQATDYALQIAQGLAAAHRKGVIHRDLKPENVFVTKDGRVKILDFGLAKLQVGRGVLTAPADGSPGTASPTLRIDPDAVINTTETGMVLGTPAYMSPEQVRGEPADHRADIFAFGAVFYEMLSGTRAFRRDTPVASMNAVLSEEPPELSATNTKIPALLDRVVRRCLEKQPDNRFQSARDLAFAIENTGSTSTSTQGVARGTKQRGLRLRDSFAWAVAGLCLAGLLLVVQRRPKPDAAAERGATAAVRKFELTLPFSSRQTADRDSLYPAISTDGRKLAYANARGLWLHRLDQVAPPILLASGENITDLFWSPQSTDIGYFSGRKLFRIGISGSTPTLVANAPEDPAPGASGAAWLGDRIVFTTGGTALLEAPAQGGKVTTALALAAGERDFHHANPLPKGRGVLFTIHRMSGTSDRIAVMDASGQRRVLLDSPGNVLWKPVFAPPHHVIFERKDESRGLWAFSISLEKLVRTGEPFRISNVGGDPSAADDGTIAYDLTTWDIFGRWQFTWVERSGKILNSIDPSLPGLTHPALSPDERRVVALSGESIAESDVWLFDLAGGGAIPFTRSAEAEDWPGWGDGGRSIVFTRRGEGSRVLSAPVDGSNPEQQLFEGYGGISGSGNFLFVSRESANGSVRRGFISMTDPQRNFTAFPEGFQRAYHLTSSPDDRMLAYASIESGRFEVYVVEFPAFTNKALVSRDGGQHPLWHRNGSELFYFRLDGRVLMSRKLKPEGAWEEPVKLFDLPESIQRSAPWFATPYAVARDGNRFLMLQRVQDERSSERAATPNVRVVMNWFEEFREKK